MEEHLRPEGPGSAAGRGGRRTSPAPRAGPLVADGAGGGLHYRRGHFRHDRAGGGARSRSGGGHFVRHRRFRLRDGRAVLCRIRRHGARGRQRLYLRLHNTRRSLRLDHRLGLDPRICHGLRHGGLGVDQILQQIIGGFWQSSLARCNFQGSLQRRHPQSAVGADYGGHHDRSGDRHPRKLRGPTPRSWRSSSPW